MNNCDMKSTGQNDDSSENSEANAKKRRLMTNGIQGGSNNEYIQAQKRNLPIAGAKYRLIKELKRNSTVVVIGETGSGKTTQIPQFIYQNGLHRNNVIGITQPRRVAAVTIAKRVSTEMTTELGDLVGYSVRFEDVTSADTKIKYLTDGMLLREALLDPLLKKYSIIILDEAHERTVHTDVLFGIVKTAQKERWMKSSQPLKPLKIIVMSAMMDVDHFSQYFSNAPVLYIEGRQYQVQIMYAVEEQEDPVFAALVTVFQIHQSAPAQHDILVFLTGQEEIESTSKTIRDIAKSLPSDCPQIKVCPLYAALPSTLQLNAFEQTPKGFRKIILATNIAETSLTIQGIKYVVDTGLVKGRTYNPNSGLDLLKVQKISKAQAWQRTGRAGRESRGVCYRTYTEVEFDSFASFTIPEILRVNLSSVVLQLLAIGIRNILEFDFMDKPSTESIISAFDQLHLLGAVEKQEKVQLTQLGRQMAVFPLEPRFSKIIIASKEFGCTDEILTIIALLSVESILSTPTGKREQANSVREKFVSSEGDHIMLLNIYKSFKSTGGNKDWCQENFLHQRNLKMATEVRKQLGEICHRANIPLRSCGPDTTVIRKCIAMGMFMKSAELQKDGSYLTLDKHQPVSIHPSSCLFKCKPAYVMYTELLQTTKCYMRNICVVDPDWLHDAAPLYFKKSNPQV